MSAPSSGRRPIWTPLSETPPLFEDGELEPVAVELDAPLALPFDLLLDLLLEVPDLALLALAAD